VKPWTTLDRRVEFSGGPIREIVRETVQLPDGRIIPDFYTARMGDYALVYAVTTEGKVLVLRQYKHGLGRVCLTFPGGYVAPGEDPAVAAERELLEETGYRGGKLTSLGSFVTNANQGCNTVHLFRATGCTPVRAPNAGDLEAMSLEFLDPSIPLGPALFEDIGLASHVTLLLLATRELAARTSVPRPVL